MHSSARQPAQKGADNSVMDLALHASDMLLSSTQIQNPPQDQYPPAESLQREEAFLIPPPLMHFPHCRLEITTSPFPTDTGKLERVALPGTLVRTLLSRFESDLQRQQRRKQQEQPQPPRHQQHQQEPTQSTLAHRPPTSSRGKNKKTSRNATHQYQQQQRRRQQPSRPVRIQPHFDDTDDWVFSRCILGDFTGFREDEAEALSAQGRLCCWASVELQPQQQRQPGQRRGRVEQKWLNTGSSTGANTTEESESANDGDDGDCAGGRGGEGDGEEHLKWELKFEVQRVGVRDPGSGWCECF
ncbi:hypothetical protein P885DRAFT_80957 [Corynascus similis CBS 632.67]